MSQPEHPHKRRRLHPWRISRLRRLLYETKLGRVTPRQRRRVEQLQRQLLPLVLAACLRPHSMSVEDRVLASEAHELCDLPSGA